MDILAAFGVGANRMGTRDAAPSAEAAPDAPAADASERESFEEKFDAQRKDEEPPAEEGEPRGAKREPRDVAAAAIVPPLEIEIEIEPAEILAEAGEVQEGFVVVAAEGDVVAALSPPAGNVLDEPAAAVPASPVVALLAATPPDEIIALTETTVIDPLSPLETTTGAPAPRAAPVTASAVAPAPTAPPNQTAPLVAAPLPRGQVGPALSDTFADSVPADIDVPPPLAAAALVPVVRADAPIVAAAPAGGPAPATVELQPALAPAPERGPVADGVSLHAAKTAPAPDQPAAADAARQVIAAIRTDKGGGGLDVRLDPPELGRVRIHFSMDAPDGVVATLSSERGDTLDLMRRHSADLVRELERAGFENVRLEFAANDNASFPRERRAEGASEPDSLVADAAADRRLVYLSMRSDNRLDRLV